MSTRDILCADIIDAMNYTRFNLNEKLLNIAFESMTGWPKNLEFDSLGKVKNLEFCGKIMEKPGIFLI